MEIVTEVTELDHNDFSRDYSIKRKWVQRLLIGLLVDAALSVFRPLSSFYLVNFIFIAIILFPFFFGIPYFLAKKRMREIYQRSPLPNGQKTYKPFASGIEITDETSTTFLRHEDIKQIGRSGNFVFIITRYSGYYLLPIWCFESHEQISHFLRVVTTGTVHVKGRQPGVPLTFKPIYLIGILCFIPLIGFFAGLVLLILGLAHYKDRVFVVLGVIGMLFTVAIYSSLFYFAFNSGIVKDSFASIAQSEVNDLVKNIEFYKLQNGAYPDSLQQLDTKDSFTNIYDPLPAFEAGKKAVPFQYERKGPKYLLFSVGQDGKPNTADDIYPTITNADTSKLGFIRKP